MCHRMPKAIENSGLLKSTYRSDAQPIIPPDLREKLRRPVNSNVEPNERFGEYSDEVLYV